MIFLKLLILDALKAINSCIYVVVISVSLVAGYFVIIGLGVYVFSSQFSLSTMFDIGLPIPFVLIYAFLIYDWVTDIWKISKHERGVQ